MRKSVYADLGSSTVRVCGDEKGVFYCEPAAAALDPVSQRAICYGREAVLLHDRTPGSVEIIRPFRDQTVLGRGICEGMFAHCCSMPFGRKVSKPRVTLTAGGLVDADDDGVELYFASAHTAGAGEAFVADAIDAAAAGMKFSSDGPVLIVVTGAVHTDFGCVNTGTVGLKHSVGVAGDSFNAAITGYMRIKHRATITPDTAEKIKIALASLDGTDNRSADFTVVRSANGLPFRVTLTSGELYTCLKPVADTISDALKAFMTQLPEPPLRITLCGGGAKLSGFAAFLSEATGIPVTVPENPELCVIAGLQAYAGQRK